MQRNKLFDARMRHSHGRHDGATMLRYFYSRATPALLLAFLASGSVQSGILAGVDQLESYSCRDFVPWTEVCGNNDELSQIIC